MTPSPAVAGVIEIPVADAVLCESACQEIYALRSRWRLRRLFDRRPFYTLGPAAYLDLGFAAEPLETYLAGVGEWRSWAGEALSTILDNVRVALSRELGQAVEITSVLPSPGFHIFVGEAIPTNDCSYLPVGDCASAHFDTQYRHIPWSRWYRSYDLARTISFTLPVKLPARGGGLLLWEQLTLSDVRGAVDEGRYDDAAAAARATPGRHIDYQVGKMVLHDGHTLHQVAGVAATTVYDERVTLQGHGVLADGSWRLYW